MAICECTFAKVVVECVLAWTPCFSIICNECFYDITFDSNHECVDLSKKITLRKIFNFYFKKCFLNIKKF